MTDPAKRRYRLARQARKKSRPTHRLLTPTRATRRSLTAMLQRMMGQAHRFKLLQLECDGDVYSLGLQGWPDAVRLHVGIHCLCLEVVHDGVFWDALVWPDCLPRRKQRRWRCRDTGCLDSREYQRLEDLLFDHLAKPFLEFLDRLPDSAQLTLHALEGRGVTWAEVSEQHAMPERTATCVACWPLPIVTDTLCRSAQDTEIL